jgi:P pilus assembly chaperone PapD
MFRIFDKPSVFFFSALMWVAFNNVVLAAGMIPETSVVLINVADGEGVINVTNSDDQATLLYTSLENLPEMVMPTEIQLELPTTYILPGQTHHFDLPAGKSAGADATVRIYPLTTYGYATDPFDAPLKKH